MKICLGCRYSLKHMGWESVDVNMDPDIYDDVFVLSTLPASSCDIIVASHILEHGPYTGGGKERANGAIDVLRLWHSKLKDDGKLYLAVPDFDYIVKAYLLNKERYFYNNPDIISPLFGGIRGIEKHNIAFNFESLTHIMEDAGFHDVIRLSISAPELLPSINTTATDVRSLNVGAVK